MRAALVEDETAVRQVERLGFTREDVRRVVLTHFDLDHIGGLADFPDAVTAAEARGAVHAPSWCGLLQHGNWTRSPRASCSCRCPATRVATQRWA